MSKPRFFISSAFLVVGTAALTYATTRTWTTELVLSRASDRVSEYLEAKNLLIGVSNQDVDIDQETHVEARSLVGRVAGSGGMKYWWNDAIPYWGGGVFLFIIGCLIPFVGRSTAASQREQHGS